MKRQLIYNKITITSEHKYSSPTLLQDTVKASEPAADVGRLSMNVALSTQTDAVPVIQALQAVWHSVICVCSVDQLCLCDPMDCSLPGSSVHGIFQARILERVAISSSRASSRPTSNQHPLGQLHRQADSLPLEPPGKPHSAMRFPERGSIPEKAPNRIEYNFPLIYTQTTILESSVLNNIVPKIKTFDIKCEIN